MSSHANIPTSYSHLNTRLQAFRLSTREPMRNCPPTPRKARGQIGVLDMRLKIGAAVLAAAISISAPATLVDNGEPSLAEVRKATERFQDVKVALAEGYIRDPMN